ncbi:hypothetical protein QFZ66_002010 [Streptomyces sp. B4I13]|uniref:Rv1733c family protein n=1 Tax=Streptomyces sp. B4I13 TaxID=3042271 RepID=UPI00277D3AB9|nr:hypothetical protein [Streptomyces sp. B4I13]MDQ0958132.1 hypothetical protein [Streptomyces sp. B4I13]
MREAQRTKRTSHLLWRWRSNPLRRRDDVVEAWIVLAVWTVIALGGTLVGVVTAHAADESFAQLRAHRHAVRAVLVESTADAVLSEEGAFGERVRAKVRWTASDGSSRTGRTLVDAGQRAGSRFVVWTDDEGRLTTEPQSASEASVEAACLGTLAALALGGLTYGAGRAARWRLDQRRTDQWGRQWEQIGPQWRRKTT